MTTTIKQQIASLRAALERLESRLSGRGPLADVALARAVVDLDRFANRLEQHLGRLGTPQNKEQ
jgi:hypothetical protein